VATIAPLWQSPVNHMLRINLISGIKLVQRGFPMVLLLREHQVHPLCHISMGISGSLHAHSTLTLSTPGDNIINIQVDM
jgi:hypothetical protein